MSGASSISSKQPYQKSAISAAVTGKIDSSCTRYTDLLPDQPYILSIPDFDLPFSKRPQDLALETSRWIRDSPFSQAEAHLQYMTFQLPDPLDSCLDARTGVDEERERRLKESLQNGTTPSELGASTPKAGPAKKKITLAAYKQKKEKGPQSESRLSPESDKPSPADITKSKPEFTPKVNGHVAKVTPESQAMTKIKSEKNLTQPIPSEIIGQSKKRKSPEPESVNVVSTPPTKKSRLDTPIELSKPAAKMLKSVSSTVIKSPPLTSSSASKKSHGLPPLLSPVRTKDIGIPALHSPPAVDLGAWIPPLLSPTIDPELEEELRRIRGRHRADSDLSSLSDPSSSKYPTPVKPVGSLEKKTSSSEIHQAQRTAEKLHKLSDPESTKAAPVEEEAEPMQPKMRLVVKLKYGRKLRGTVDRILKQPVKHSRPVLGPAFAEEVSSDRKSTNRRDQVQPKAKSSPKRDTRDATPTPIKKEQPHDDAVQDSKKRTLDSPSHEKPTKKSRPSALSNGPPRFGASKHEEPPPVTPVQDEFDSRKMGDFTTPQNASAASKARSTTNNSISTTPRNLTPLPPLRNAGTDRNSKLAGASNNNPRASQIAQLADCSRKFNAHGRALKHKAQRRIENREIIAKQEAAIYILESIMAYMIAYTYEDFVTRLKKRPQTYESTWYTLHKYVINVVKYTKPFPELDGLHRYLCYMIAHKAAECMIEHLDLSVTESTASPQSVLGQTIGDQQPSPATAQSAAQHTVFDRELPKRLRAMYQSAKTGIVEARSLLSDARMAQNFPETWASREQGPQTDDDISANQERTDMVNLVAAGKSGGQLTAGRFWLPISDASSPIQGVRFGMALCTEWMKREGIAYEIGLADIK